jgi:hypothetical protein
MTPKPLSSNRATGNRVQSWLMNRTEKTAREAIRSDPNGLYRALLEAHGSSSSIGISLFEAAALYSAVLRFRPKRILELGAGLSSIVLGYAAKRLSESGLPSEVHSWEESAAYFHDLQPLIPEAIRPFLTISVGSPIRVAESDRWIGVRFPEKSPAPYDLVFVDGPEYPERIAPQTGESRHFDADVLDVLGWNPSPLVVLVDGRRQTVAALRELRPFGVWRYGRMSPLSISPPRMTTPRIRNLVNKALVRVLGRESVPPTLNFWFVPAASSRLSTQDG